MAIDVIARILSVKGAKTSKEYTDTEIAKIQGREYIVVDELPETGDSKYIYLVKSTTPGREDTYDEYVWVESLSTFEPLGGMVRTILDVDELPSDNINQYVIYRVTPDNTYHIYNGDVWVRLATESDIANINDALEQEIQDRTNADNDLSDKLNQEIQDRIEADSNLDNKLEKEISDRIEADNNLSDRLDQEIIDRTNADNDLNDRLEQEIADRIAGDEKLSDDLAAEISNRETADNELKAADIILQSNIDKEISDRSQADNDIIDLLNKEISDRTSGDETLQSALDQEKSDRADADSALNDALAQEISDRTSGDNDLWDALNKEISDRENGDNTLQGKLDTEISDRKAADNELVAADLVLQTNINTEISDRELADDNLLALINKEIQDRTSGDSGLRTDLNQEITDRINADSEIRSSLTQETENRISGDQAIINGLNDEIAERQSEDASIRGDVATINTAISGIKNQIENHTLRADVPADAVFTDTTYAPGNNVTISGSDNRIDVDDMRYNDEELRTLIGQKADNADLLDEVANRQSGDSALDAKITTNSTNITNIKNQIGDHILQADVPADAVFTDTTYSPGTGISITGSDNAINVTIPVPPFNASQAGYILCVNAEGTGLEWTELPRAYGHEFGD